MRRIIITLAVLLSFAGTLFAQRAFIGEIRLLAGSYAPKKWMNCEGQLLSIAQYQELYAVLGTTYGGDGVSNFALPDLRGRVPVGQGSLPGGTRPYYQGDKGGAERTVLAEGNMPEHSHSADADINVNVAVRIPVNNNESETPLPINGYIGRARTGIESFTDEQTPNTYLADPEVTANASGTVSVGVSGTSKPFDILQPYQVIRYIICINGVIPPHN